MKTQPQQRNETVGNL